MCVLGPVSLINDVPGDPCMGQIFTSSVCTSESFYHSVHIKRFALGMLLMKFISSLAEAIGPAT